MKKVKDFLLKDGYEITYNSDYCIDGINEFLRIMIIKKEDGSYLIRNAILCFFDRWANSGIEFCLETDVEVINYFLKKEKCITEAVSELVSSIIEDNDETNIRKMIDFLYELVNNDDSEK